MFNWSRRVAPRSASSEQRDGQPARGHERDTARTAGKPATRRLLRDPGGSRGARSAGTVLWSLLSPAPATRTATPRCRPKRRREPQRQLEPAAAAAEPGEGDRDPARSPTRWSSAMPAASPERAALVSAPRLEMNAMRASCTQTEANAKARLRLAVNNTLRGRGISRSGAGRKKSPIRRISGSTKKSEDQAEQQRRQQISPAEMAGADAQPLPNEFGRRRADRDPQRQDQRRTAGQRRPYEPAGVHRRAAVQSNGVIAVRPQREQSSSASRIRRSPARPRRPAGEAAARGQPSRGRSAPPGWTPLRQCGRALCDRVPDPASNTASSRSGAVFSRRRRRRALPMRPRVQSLHHWVKLRMPTFKRFGPVSVRMDADDHRPPHFHIVSSDFQVLVRISDLRLIAGKARPAQIAEAIAWAAREKRESLALKWAELNELSTAECAEIITALAASIRRRHPQT